MIRLDPRSMSRVFTGEEFTAALEREAEQLSVDYEQRFRGMKATDVGIQMDLAVTMDGWLP